MTPFEVWHGKKPAVHHLKVFGCIAYVLNTTPHLKKLEDRGRKMIFIGYECGSKAYRAYDPTTRRVHVTRDVVFDENAQWDWGSGPETLLPPPPPPPLPLPQRPPSLPVMQQPPLSPAAAPAAFDSPHLYYLLCSY
ncbi:unnamed protein product [Spirodela intermedia]|uniref:Retroviral polymerase SH3-like domain-containing protein n=1 Tax=Spirodela intermedia TaxID=51605 RepID=A0ABN7EAM5_SPIIN|nr:unnamed protein product [Spirodela intermedia]